MVSPALKPQPGARIDIHDVSHSFDLDGRALPVLDSVHISDITSSAAYMLA